MEQVSKLLQVEAALLVQGDEGREVHVVADQFYLGLVDAVAEIEGQSIDELGELKFLSHVLFRQGRPLSEFYSPSTLFLFQR